MICRITDHDVALTNSSVIPITSHIVDVNESRIISVTNAYIDYATSKTISLIGDRKELDNGSWTRNSSRRG